MSKIKFDPKKFVLTNIEVQQISKGSIYSQTVLFHGHKIKIVGKNSFNIADGYVELGFYRPKDVFSVSIPFKSRIRVAEYFQDIRNFFFILAQIEPEIENVPVGLKRVCEFHIKNYKRLIDIDIFTYCDEAVVVAELILNCYNPKVKLSESDKIILWNHYKDVVFGNFKEFIVLAKDIP